MREEKERHERAHSLLLARCRQGLGFGILNAVGAGVIVLSLDTMHGRCVVVLMSEKRCQVHVAGTYT